MGPDGDAPSSEAQLFGYELSCHGDLYRCFLLINSLSCFFSKIVAMETKKNSKFPRIQLALLHRFRASPEHPDRLLWRLGGEWVHLCRQFPRLYHRRE